MSSLPRLPRERKFIGGSAHGTHSGYVRGCRCQPCTDANTAHQASYRAARKQRQA